jgi:hypothetical protein
MAQGKFAKGKMIATGGYDTLITLFERRTGLRYDNIQFRNRIAQLKKLYGFIKQITQSTGLGCGPNRWPEATDEWWEDVCQVHCASMGDATVAVVYVASVLKCCFVNHVQGVAEFKKLKHGPPSYLNLLEEIFDEIVVDGSTAFVPGVDNMVGEEADGDEEDQEQHDY